MKLYKYKARDSNGYPCAGTLKAENEDDARRGLVSQGREVVEIEEDHEGAQRVSSSTLNRLDTYHKPRDPWAEILAYAMPAGAIVIAVVMALAAAAYLKPPEVKSRPEEVIEAYIKHEVSGAYEQQFSLFTKPRQEAFGSSPAYALRRKEIRPSSDDGFFRFGKPSGIKAVDQGRQQAVYEAHLLRPTGVVEVQFLLTLSKGQWKIDGVRDPAQVEAFLVLLDEAGQGDKEHRIRVELKSETLYPDLEIDALLRAYQKKKRRSEIGGTDIFSL